MKIYWKHILRKIKASPMQPILIVCALCVAVASVLLALKVSGHLYRDTANEKRDHSYYDLSIKLSSQSEKRLLIADEVKDLVGEDGTALGVFSLTGLGHWGDEKELCTVSCVKLEEADAFCKFKFTSYGEFTEENRRSTVILSKETADRHGLSLGDTFTFSLLGKDYAFTVGAIALSEGVLGECDCVIDLAAIADELARQNPAIASLAGNFSPANLLLVKLKTDGRAEEIAARLASHPSYADTRLTRSADEIDHVKEGNTVTLIVTAAVSFIVITLSGILAVGALDLLQKERNTDTALFLLAGAERKHLHRLRYAESLLYGLFGMIGGLMLSLPLNRILSRMAGRSLSLSFSGRDVVAAALAAPALILLFTFLQIRHTKRLSLSELLTEERISEKKKRPKKALLFFSLCLAVILTVTYFLPVHKRYVGAICALVAGVGWLFLLLPFWIDLLSSFLYKILQKKSKPHSYLYMAAANIRTSYPLRHIGRLMALVLSLLTPITLCVCTLSEEKSSLEEIVACDYVALGADSASEALLMQEQGVGACYRFCFTRTFSTVYGTDLRTLAADERALPYLCPDYAPARLPQGDEIVLSRGVAALYSADVGDRIELLYDTRTYAFTVSEIIDVFSQIVYVDASYVGIDMDMLCIRAEEDAKGDALFTRLSNRLELRGALLCERDDTLSFAVKRASIFYALIAATTLAATAATLFGIANLIFAQYRARKNDLRAYRAAGLTHADVRRLLLCELLLLLVAALIVSLGAAYGFCRLLDVSVNAFGADIFH